MPLRHRMAVASSSVNPPCATDRAIKALETKCSDKACDVAHGKRVAQKCGRMLQVSGCKVKGHIFGLNYQRKFRSFNFRLYRKLPLGLVASMLDSRDVLQHRCETWEILAGRNCAKCCVFPFVALKARKISSEKRGGAEDRLPKMATKFAPRLRARAI